MTDGLKTVKSVVGSLLEQCPELRDSDKMLWLAYLNVEHNVGNVIGWDAYSKLKAVLLDERTPTMESVRRIRQKYQESGLYTGKKRKERMKEAVSVRDWALTEKRNDH
jgi:hypothetical protein